MRFRLFFILVFLSPFLFVCKKTATKIPKTATKPNIVFIMADDMGYNDLHHHLALSPNPRVQRFIDQEATEVQNFTVMSNCSPSRHALISGQYSYKNGRNSYGMKPSVPNYGLDSKKTIGEEMQENGYKTGLFGKWHLAETYTPDPNTFPFNRGFDRFFGLIGGSFHYYTHKTAAYHDLYDQDVCTKNYKGISISDLTSSKTVEFMREHCDEPFFAFVSFTAPHKPYVIHPDADDSYAGCSIGDDRRFWIMKDFVRNVERLLDELDELGISDNTVVILTSDNGGVADECGSSTFNAPLRDYKGTLYEGGIRARFYVRFPKEGVGGQKIPVAAPSHIVDMYPTFTAIADGNVDIETDGINMLPIWKGDNTNPNRVIINDLAPGARYVGRMGNYKLASNAGDRITDLTARDQNWEFFDLENDPGEQMNLYGTGLPEEAFLQDTLLKAEADYKAPIYEEVVAEERDCLIF